MILLVNIIIMPLSFLVGCFMNDITTIVNHNLILYRVCLFFLPRIVYSFFFFIDRSWYLLLFGQSIKARKPGKYSSTSSAGVFSLFVIGYIFCGIGTHCLTSPSIFWMSLADVTLIQIKEKSS